MLQGNIPMMMYSSFFPKKNHTIFLPRIIKKQIKVKTVDIIKKKKTTKKFENIIITISLM